MNEYKYITFKESGQSPVSVHKYYTTHPQRVKWHQVAETNEDY